MNLPIRIDDKKLREHAFSLAQTLLKKLDRLEKRIETFEQSDQRQFLDWQQLVFQDRRQRIDRVLDDHRKLGTLYNAIVALSRMQDISLAQALILLRNEEKAYEGGSAEVRRTIDAKRKEREDFIQRESEEELRQARQRDEKRKRKAEKAAAQEEEEREEELAAISDMTDDEIQQWCKTPQIAGSWLWLCLWDARETSNAELFFRVWTLTDMKIQKLFTRRFEHEYGISLKEVIDRMRKIQPDQQPNSQDRPSSHIPRAGVAQPNRLELRAETIKLIYRQLVRKLHPDKQTSLEKQSVWQKKLWFRVQDAYRAQDLESLDKLLRMVLLRTGELNDLRLSEIVESQQWLEDELELTERGIRGLRRSPAWGFSVRKDYGPVVRKLERQFEQDQIEAESMLYNLQCEITMLERLGREASKVGRQHDQARKNRKRANKSDEQFSFFD